MSLSPIRMTFYLYLVCFSRFALGDTHGDSFPHLVRHTSVAFGDTAISELLDSSKFPGDMAHFRQAMERRWGPVEATVVPFSDAPGETDLDNPRTLYGSASGELFIGTIHHDDGAVTFEFISKNRRTGKYDFGVVKNYGKPNEEAMIVNRAACITCHKAEGPIFPRGSWSNTIGIASGDNKFGLYRAFLERLALREPKYRQFRDEIERLFHLYFETQPPPTGRAFEGAVSLLERRFGDGVTWKGINLASILNRNSGFFERAVVHANQQLVLDSYVQAGTNSQERMRRLREILGRGIHGDFPENENDNFYSTFSGISENRPVILKDTMDEVFRTRFPGFDSSREAFLRYNEAKKREGFRNTLPELSATRNSSFLAGSNPLGGRGTQSHSTELNKLYFDGIWRYFSHIDEPEASTEDPVTRVLREKFRLTPNPDLFRFLRTELDTFLGSPLVRQALESGRLPSPGMIQNLFHDYELNQPFRPDSLYRGRPEDVRHGGTKRCLDCHAGMVDGVRFNFEVSDINAWRQELSSDDAARIQHARRWLRRVLSELEGDAMPPPPFQSTLTGSQKAELIQFLRQNTNAQH